MCGRLVSEWLATTLSYSAVSLCPQNLFPFRMTLSLGKRKRLQGTKSGKSAGKPLGCCAWPKTPWQPGPLVIAHYCGVVSRYQKTLFWWNMNICGIREEIHDAPDPSHVVSRIVLVFNLPRFLWPMWWQHCPLGHLFCCRIVTIHPFHFL